MQGHRYVQSATKKFRHQHSNRATSENKTLHTSFPYQTLHSKLACLLFSTSSSNSSTTLHGGNGGRKALFSPFEVVKLQKGLLGQSVSTYFVTDSLNQNLGTVALSAQVKSDNFFSVTIFTRSFFMKVDRITI